MDIQSIAMAAIPALIAVSIQWGINRTEVKALQDLLKELRENHEVFKEKVVMKEHCHAVHIRSERDIDRMATSIEAIREMLTNFITSHGGKVPR